VSFAAITLCVASQRVFIFVSVYFVVDSVRKLWIHPSITQISVTDKVQLRAGFIVSAFRPVYGLGPFLNIKTHSCLEYLTSVLQMFSL
jgi:uncharacterized membrane protein